MPKAFCPDPAGRDEALEPFFGGILLQRPPAA